MSDSNGDAILIHELDLETRIGVPDEERGTPQQLTVSITMWPAVGFAEMRDEIERTVNYAAVAEEVKAFCPGRADKLIETLAEAIAAHLLERYPLRRVRVELRKFVLPHAKFVAAICERSN